MKEQHWRARIVVTLKPVVNDPQGLAIAGGLVQMGYQTVQAVRAGKYFEIFLTAPSKPEAERLADEMCHRLLANPVIEGYRLTVARLRRADLPYVAEAP